MSASWRPPSPRSSARHAAHSPRDSCRAGVSREAERRSIPDAQGGGRPIVGGNAIFVLSDRMAPVLHEPRRLSNENDEAALEAPHRLNRGSRHARTRALSTG